MPSGEGGLAPVMDACFFPSYAWPGDGAGDCGASLPACPHQAGPFPLPPPVGAAAPSLVHWPSASPSSSFVVGGEGSAEARAAASSKIHSLAERRRRERINGHLSTLRRMIPNANKMDKASLLASVIHEIRILKVRAGDVSSGGFTVPVAVNQVSVECGASDEQANRCSALIKASICCDDRPDLFTDIMEAFHGLRLKPLRADMVSLGGRVQTAFVLCRTGSDGDVGLSCLMDHVRRVLGRVASLEELGSTHLSSKRRRFFQQPHYSDTFSSPCSF